MLAALRVAALTALGAELAYVAAANVVLGGGVAARHFSPTDQSTTLRYEGAWSIVPGVVQFRRVSLQGQDNNVQWRLELGEGSLRVSVPMLARRQIAMRHLRGEGVSFRLRHRVRPERARAPDVAAYPPIGGYDDPPLLEYEAKPETDREKAWEVSLADVEASVREVWVQEFRYEGPGRLYGAFHLVPGERLWVGPAELEFLGGRLSVGEHEAARGVEGVVRCDIPSFELDEPKGLEVVRRISGSVDLEAQVTSLAFLDLYGLPGGAEARDGSGQLSARLRFDHGVAAPGSSVRYEAGRLVVRRGPASLVAASAGARFEAKGGASSLWVGVPAASLWAGEGEGAVAWARGLEGALALPATDFSSPASFEPQGARLEVESAGADDLSRLHDLVGQTEGWALRGGRARASAALRTDGKGQASGEVRAKAERLDLVAADTRWTGDVSLDASIAPFAPRPGAEVPGSLRVVGRDVAFTPRGGEGRSGYWFALDARGARLDLAPFGLRAGWALEARDLSPLTAALAGRGSMPSWFAEWLDLEGLKASGGVSYGSGRFDLGVASARAGALDAKGRYLVAPAGSEGAFRVAMGPLAVGLRLRQGKVDVAWPVGDGWLEGEARSLGAGATRAAPAATGRRSAP
ncbi:MAG TPA: hypothetical protein VFS43_05360 [Polyangiaceae bacterium]|nr:hypothetical protein [Polyangiaceae bacterium]